MERKLCARDYEVKGYTTRDEARRMTTLLGLQPGSRLLDVGAGAGWPGLYFAKETGCDAVLVDLPLKGLQVASERAANDRISDRCRLEQTRWTVTDCFDVSESYGSLTSAVKKGLLRRDLFVATPTLT